MKKITLFLTTQMFLTFTCICQVPIKPGIFGQNAWFIKNSDPDPSLNIPWNDVKSSGVKYIRIGGIDANFRPLYTWAPTTLAFDALGVSKLTKLIDAARNNGMQPIIQVSFDPTTSAQCSTSTSPLYGMSLQDQATVAANLVDYINHTVYPANPVKYWIIANEPDKQVDCANPKGFGYNDATFAGNLSSYFKTFSAAMKANDPSIKIIGPELASFTNDFYDHSNELMTQLISNPISNANSIMGTIPPANVLYYVDIISFHYYPSHTLRTDVIDDPTRCKGFAHRLASSGTCGGMTQQGLQEMINAAGRNISNIKLACTEYNLENAETSIDESTSTGYNNMRDGIGNRSFLGGQWLAEIFSQAMNTYQTTGPANIRESWVELMNFWSVRENGETPSTSTTPLPDPCLDGKGYISNCGAFPAHKYRSTYNHFKLMAKYFQGNFFMGEVTGTGSDKFKAFAAKSCDGIWLMLMNQDDASSRSVSVSLNATTPTTGSGIRVKIGTLGIAAGSKTNIPFLIGPAETWLVKFDPCGNTKLGYFKYNHTMDVPDPFVPLAGPKCFCIQKPANALLRCSEYPPDTSITLNGSTLIIHDTTIAGIVTVPNGATLTIQNAEVAFSTGARINLASGAPPARLVIENSYLHGCDGQSWAGIGMDIGGELIIDSSFVTDAITVVESSGPGSLSITSSSFQNGTEAIKLTNNKDFTISQNSFSGYDTGISTASCTAGTSLINYNYFTDVTEGIRMINSNHSGLDITCNTFENYLNYAVHSTNCTLKNQGSATAGAGNSFFSSSLLPNHRFSHSGNTMTYHTDPSEPFTLLTGLGMNAMSSLASADGCSSSSRFGDSTPTEPVENKYGITNIVPNPAVDRVEIHFTLQEGLNQDEIIITNVYGEFVARQAVDAISGKTEVDCSKLAGGIYFATLAHKGNALNTKKIMIAR